MIRLRLGITGGLSECGIESKGFISLIVVDVVEVVEEVVALVASSNYIRSSLLYVGLLEIGDIFYLSIQL